MKHIILLAMLLSVGISSKSWSHGLGSGLRKTMALSCAIVLTCDESNYSETDVALIVIGMRYTFSNQDRKIFKEFNQSLSSQEDISPHQYLELLKAKLPNAIHNLKNDGVCQNTRHDGTLDRYAEYAPRKSCLAL
ncbi:MAG: hypothetical protein KAQ98_12840 [Bacteriovoracaceae bacterium]|nr:hypothetical protein [Bacteriovoracaceae bacterium]